MRGIEDHKSLPSIHCPHCDKHTALSLAHADFEYAHEEHQVPCIWKANSGHQWWIGICNGCGMPVLILNAASLVWPTPQPSPTSTSIPEPMHGDLVEAKSCFAVSAWRGTAVLARRTIQSAALDNGAKPGATLNEQIRELFQTNLITKDLKEWADVVRWIGNDGAHPGGDPVTKEDAEDILELAPQFLQVLYVAPATAAGLRARKNR